MTNIIKKPKTTVVTFIIAIMLMFILPLHSYMKLCTVVCFTTLTLWGLNAISNNIVALGFIIACLFFKLAPVEVVLEFPMTENFYLIILSYLISHMVTSTGTAKIFSRNIMNKMATTPIKLILFSYIAGFLLIFFIPQPFPRVILLTAFYKEFLSKQELPDKTKSILFFSIFTASTFTSMFFINADTLLNYVVVKLAGANMNWIQWAIYMSVPTLVCCIVTFILFLLVFKKDLNNQHFKPNDKNIKTILNAQNKKTILICAVILIGFSTQSFHNLRASYILGLGVILGISFKLIRIDSLKSINWSLLLFFTAAFSVGGVLNHCGFANLLADWLVTLIPQSNNHLTIMSLTFITLVLNFLLGSAVTTSSVVVPTIAHIGVFSSPSILCLFVYTIVSVQYILPFHHATIMVGYGEKLYDSKTIAKYGIWLTLFTFILVMFVCIPWWNLVI